MKEEIEDKLRVFVGWDSREDIAFQVCKQTILDKASVPVHVEPLKQRDLRRAQIYTRETDALASTEFTFTRFLIPHLMNYKGWALFVDCDFVFLEDIAKLFDQCDDKYAVMCAHHDYTPKEGLKMDGKQQHNYPRKNWSSCMLINCGHPSNARLTAELVNKESTTGAFLHRFSWLSDDEVGEISHKWNWLVGWYKEPEDGKPKALHYTEGGPWFPQYQDCEYALDWYRGKIRYLETQVENSKKKLERSKDKIKLTMDLDLPAKTKTYFHNLLNSWIDPDEHVYKSKESIEKFEERNVGIKVAAIAPAEEDGFNLRKKNALYDPYLEDFIIGCNGTISEFDREKKSDNTLIIRGLGGGGQKALKHCIENDRNYYAIDTGYLQPGTKKEYHRITYNNLQQQGPIIERPYDRLERLKYKVPKYREGEHILLCPPSLKVMKFYGEDLDKWIARTTTEIRKYTDRRIVVRQKPIRRDRVTNDTIWKALDNAYCLVTYNSIAATEALLHRRPAIALAPNAATALCNTKISDIDGNLNRYGADETYAFAAHLSYCQFTAQEMRNGKAWQILNESR